MQIKNLLEWQYDNIPVHRIEHMQRTAIVAEELATIHDLNAEKAYLAGLMHDIAKDKSDDDLLKISMQHNLINHQEEKDAPHLLHGQVGSYILANSLNFTDKDILFTISWHTTGHYNYKDWAWATFLADKLEPQKIEENNALKPILSTAKNSLVDAVKEFIIWRLKQREDMNKIIHPMSAEILKKI
ncbi:MAG: bis(5'-nucleosyl)-tetraphosphatase (symmetrical) YqeK [Dehalococcoidia bacterium]